MTKIFRKDKKSQSKSAPTPVEKPETVEWQVPWFETVDADQEVPEYQDDIVLESVDDVSKKPPAIEPKQYGHQTMAPVPGLTEEIQKETGLAALNISLESTDDLKRGIIVAEILGSCKANKRSQRF